MSLKYLIKELKKVYHEDYWIKSIVEDWKTLIHSIKTNQYKKLF